MFRPLCLVLAFAGPALATPPQTLTLSETVIAASDNQIVTLRHVEDNLGYHHTTLTTTFVAITDLDGSGTTLHLLRQTLDHGPFFADYGETTRLTERAANTIPLPDLLPDGARPVTPAHIGPSGLGAVSDDGYILMTNRRVLDIPAAAITEALTRVAAETQTALPPRDTREGWTLPDAAQNFTHRDCLPQTAHYLDAHIALYLNCRGGDGADHLSFYLPWPDPAP